jgi:hypothetical protein
MSTKVPHNNDDQEIDLVQVSKKINAFFEAINRSIFRGIQFFVRNWIIVLVLVLVGFGLGFFLDKTNKMYIHEIIVKPNFESNDYLYSRINLLEAKIKENDTLFLKGIGFSNPKSIKSIEIKPIIDVYGFSTKSPQNFEVLKLIAEDGDMNKIIEDETTSINYTYHQILIKTNSKVAEKKFIKGMLSFLNSSDYFLKIQEQEVKNVKILMKQNDSIIKQIDGLLNEAKLNSDKESRNANLVYYNDNNQLNDIIKTKENLIKDQGFYQLNLINYDKIIKEVSAVCNLYDIKAVYGKYKLILPIIFVIGFMVFRLFLNFYKNESLKFKQ